MAGIKVDQQIAATLGAHVTQSYRSERPGSHNRLPISLHHWRFSGKAYTSSGLCSS